MPKLGITLKEIPVSISAGVVIGILALFLQVSYAAMVFSGELGGFLPQGMGIFLLGAVIMGFIGTMMSSYVGSIIIPEDSTAAIMGVVATAIAASMTMVTPSAAFATVVAAMMFSSVFAGVLLWLLGRFNLGRLVRYMPYPVAGGFLAGIGWLLSIGGIGVMTDGVLGPDLVTGALLLRWLPGFLLGAFMLLITLRYSHFLLMPGMLAASIGLFYLAYYLLNGEVGSAQADGWLLGPFPEEGLFRPVTLLALTEGNWMVVLGNGVNLGAIFIVGTISLLLNATGAEIATRSNIDLNQELKTVGVANVVGGLAGSSFGYHSLSLSTLGHRLGASSRLVGLVAVAVIASALFFGAGLLATFPKMVAGGFLLYLGLSFLKEWLYDSRLKLAKLDYLLIWLILVTIILFGMLEGVSVGILVSALLFIGSYATTKTIRHTLTRQNFQSYVMRPTAHEMVLQEQGQRLAIFELQGFIFFGSAHTLVEQIRSLIEENETDVLSFILLDFRLVTGVDSSAALSFSRLKQVAEQANIVLILTNLAAPFQRQLHDSVTNIGTESRTLLFAELDQGVAWAEELILADAERSLAAPSAMEDKRSSEPEPQTFLQYFEKTLTPPAQADQIGTPQNIKWAEERALTFMDKVEVEPETVLLEEGAPVDKVYFIEEGQIVIYYEHDDGHRQQLRIQEAGTVFGEIGIYSGQMATATVAAKEDAVLYALSGDNFALMETQDPELAIVTHRLIANVLGRKLTQANYTIVALQK